MGGFLVSVWCCVASITCRYGLVCVGVLFSLFGVFLVVAMPS